jgi:hypothetical protein
MQLQCMTNHNARCIVSFLKDARCFLCNCDDKMEFDNTEGHAGIDQVRLTEYN